MAPVHPSPAAGSASPDDAALRAFPSLAVLMQQAATGAAAVASAPPPPPPPPTVHPPLAPDGSPAAVPATTSVGEDARSPAAQPAEAVVGDADGRSEPASGDEDAFEVPDDVLQPLRPIGGAARSTPVGGAKGKVPESVARRSFWGAAAKTKAAVAEREQAQRQAKAALAAASESDVVGAERWTPGRHYKAHQRSPYGQPYTGNRPAWHDSRHVTTSGGRPPPAVLKRLRLGSPPGGRKARSPTRSRSAPKGQAGTSRSPSHGASGRQRARGSPTGSHSSGADDADAAGGGTSALLLIMQRREESRGVGTPRSRAGGGGHKTPRSQRRVNPPSRSTPRASPRASPRRSPSSTPRSRSTPRARASPSPPPRTSPAGSVEASSGSSRSGGERVAGSRFRALMAQQQPPTTAVTTPHDDAAGINAAGNHNGDRQSSPSSSTGGASGNPRGTGEGTPVASVAQSSSRGAGGGVAHKAPHDSDRVAWLLRQRPPARFNSTRTLRAGQASPGPGSRPRSVTPVSVLSGRASPASPGRRSPSRVPLVPTAARRSITGWGTGRSASTAVESNETLAPPTPETGTVYGPRHSAQRAKYRARAK